MEYECRYFWEEPLTNGEIIYNLKKSLHEGEIKMNLNFDITFESQENYDEFVNRHLNKMNAVLNDFFRIKSVN